MIRSKDLNKEIAALENITKPKEKDPEAVAVVRANLKATLLLLKLLRDVKSNQVLLLKKEGVELIKPTTKEEKK